MLSQLLDLGRKGTQPVSNLDTAIVMVKGSFSTKESSPLGGKTNLADGMLSTDGMTPMGAGLQDPVWICFPFVIGRFGTVRQKLMKLFVDVSEATWPVVTEQIRINEQKSGRILIRFTYPRQGRLTAKLRVEVSSNR